MGALIACMSVNYVNEGCLKRPEGVVKASGTWFIAICKTACWWCLSNAGVQWEEQVL